MPGLFLEGAAKPLLVFHALAAFAGVGSCTHLVLVCLRVAGRGTDPSRLVRVYAQVVGATFAAAFALGLCMYPHYRYQVRGLYLDRYAPWASNLFDVKEILAGLGLPLSMALFFVGRRFDAREQPELTPYLTILACGVWSVVVAAAVSGLLVTSVRGV